MSNNLLWKGIGLLTAGFIVLSMANRMASNWAGYISPFIVLAGWTVIIVHLWKIN